MGLPRNILLCLSLSIVVGIAASQFSLEVSSESGKVRGKTETLSDGKKVNVWYGVPYAEPPTKNLRFKRPVPIAKWKGVRNATERTKVCMQPYDTQVANISGLPVKYLGAPMSEDCLHLSIYTPEVPSNNTVLVIFTGIQFFAGNLYGKLLDIKGFVAETNSIVVIVQFRYGAFGFLYSGTEEAQGNMGLFDQHLALKWIHNNIKSFGGNKNMITIWGEQSGSSSAALHLLYRPSWPYFSQVILDSKHVLSDGEIETKEEGISKTLKLAQSLGCPNDTNKLSETVTCLRGKRAMDIVNNTKVESVIEVPFAPLIDGDFVTDSPRKMYLKGDYKKVNILMGVTSDPSAFYFIKFFKHLAQKNISLTHANFIKYLKIEDAKYTKLTNEIITFQYTDISKGNADDINFNRDAMKRMANERFYFCPMFELASLILRNTSANMFVYIFDHRMTNSPHEPWVGPSFIENAVFLSGRPLHAANFTQDEKELSRTMMNFWANFASTGNPNINADGKQTLVSWPKFEAKEHKYLSLSTNSQVKTNVFGRQCYFWQQIFTQIQENCQS